MLETEPLLELEPLRSTVLILWMYFERPSGFSSLGRGLDMVDAFWFLSFFVQLE